MHRKTKKTAAILLALSNSRVTEKNNFYGLRGSTFCCHGTSTERSASVNWCKFNLAHKFLLRPLFFAATKRMRRPAHMLIHRSGMRCCAIARPSCLRWPPHIATKRSYSRAVVVWDKHKGKKRLRLNVGQTVTVCKTNRESASNSNNCWPIGPPNQFDSLRVTFLTYLVLAAVAFCCEGRVVASNASASQ